MNYGDAMYKLIVNVNESWGIGKNNNLLCTFPEDFNRFKDLTMYKTIICGRKTLEGFPEGKPLLNRTNIVVTTSKDHISKTAKDGCNYYSFMKRLKKRNNCILTGINCVDMISDNPRPGNTKLIATDQIETVSDIANIFTTNPNNVFICGGASIYKYFLPMCDKCYVTMNNSTEQADTFFPVNLYDSIDWVLTETSEGVSIKDNIKYKFLEFTRLCE